MAKRFGPEHVAIGTDVAYSSRNSAAENRKVPRSAKKRVAWRYYWPGGALQHKSAAPLSLAWTNWPLFTVGLVQRGYKDEEIRKIIGGNVLRVAKAALEA